MSTGRVSLFAVTFLLVSFTVVAERDLGDLRIPEDHVPEWSPGVEGGIPDIPTRITLTPTSDEAAGSRDRADDIQQAIDSLETPGAVLLKAGTYVIGKPLSLRAGVVLRGESMDATHLRFEFGEEHRYAMVAQGDEVSVRLGGTQDIMLASGYEQGSRTLVSREAPPLSEGQFVALVCENDPAKHWLTGRAEPYAKNHIVGQVCRVTRVSGNDIEIDRPVRSEYFREELHPRLRLFKVIENVGIEDIHMWCNRNARRMVNFNCTANCWITRCHLDYCLNSKVGVRVSRGITVRDSIFHHAYGYGAGGQGYGVSFGWWATDCLVENNVFYSLRHAMELSTGANGNVFAYNASKRCRHNCDISMHGFYSYMNLFEGNIVENVDYADFWGRVGPENTCFRNRVVVGGIQVKASTHDANILLNTLLKKGINIPQGKDGAWIEKNLFADESKAGGLDAVTPASGVPEWKVPASLFRTEKPEFWGEQPWPCIGADVDAGSIKDVDSLMLTPAGKRMEEFLAGPFSKD